MKKKILLSLATISLLGTSAAIVASANQELFKNNGIVASTNDVHTLVFSSANPVSGSQVRSTDGNLFWAKGDTSSGVTWNNGNNKIQIASNGYIQLLSAIKGINKVRVDLVSGSLSLYYDYKEPTDLETPMYETGHVFSATGEYTFVSGIMPKRVRLIATEASVVSKITLYYDCVTDQSDSNLETIVEDGFENSFIDSGSIGTYATTSFVTGEGNTSSSFSKRALKLTFKNTKNNYVSFNTEKDVTKHLLDARPDFTKAVVTLKAKFSSDVSSDVLTICPLGSSWQHPGYIVMNKAPTDDRGWYSYSCSFNYLSFADNNSIIRFNVRPQGINSSNKSTAYVLLDEVNYHLESSKTRVQAETCEDGMENIAKDTGWQNTYVDFDQETTFGLNSKNSICVRPGKKSYNGTYRWFVSISPESDSNYSAYHSTDFSSGALEFYYKPVNMSNPNIVKLGVLHSWDSEDQKTAEVTCKEIRNGWYRFYYDLSGLGLSSGSVIRFNLGFGESGDSGKVYIDNIKKRDLIRESWSQGLENSSLDEGMSSYSTNTPEYSIVGSDTSFTSMKQEFLTGGWQNKFAMFFNLDNTYKTATKLGSGKLEAKFKFSEQFVSKKINLNMIDDSWNAIRYLELTPTRLANGWYMLDLDLADLYANWSNRTYDSGVDPEKPILKFGFGFTELTDDNAPGRVVYIDDVFYTPKTSSSQVSNATIWQAYNTETIKIDDSVPSNRIITDENPLYFSDGRNGVDSAQLMIKANSSVSSFNFKPGKLTNESGETMSPQCFETLVEKYQYVSDSIEKSSSQYGWQGNGYYPDATVPMDRIIAAGENYVNSGNQQGLWINCSIPKEQSPGTYVGNSIISIDGKDYAVATKVKVYNFTLNDENNSKTCFCSWDDILDMYLEDNGLPASSNGLKFAYYDFVSDRRLSPDHLRSYEYKEEGMDEYESFAYQFTNFIMPNEKVSTYRLSIWDKSYDNFYNYLNALITKNIEEWDSGNHVSFFDKLIFYLNDEPNEPLKKPQDDSESIAEWADVKTNNTNLHNAIDALKSRLNSYPYLQQSFIDVRNVLPFNCPYDTITGTSYTYKTSSWSSTKTAYYPNYLTDEYVDTPCPTFEHFGTSTVRSSYHDKFDHVWFYGCVVPWLPYPSYHLDTRLLNQRLIKWMQYDYDVEGEVYYATNMFAKDVGNGWERRDIWNDAMVDGKAYGDGALVYPGDRYNIYGPISTARLENIRNANEDLELFYLFDENVSTYNANTGSSYTSAKDFMSLYMYNMYTDTKPNPSYLSNDFMNAREVLLTQLQYCF